MIMKETKKNKILDWLKSGKPITVVMAIQMFDCLNLKNIIALLRKDGYNIDTESVITQDGRRFFRYVLNNK